MPPAQATICKSFANCSTTCRLTDATCCSCFWFPSGLCSLAARLVVWSKGCYLPKPPSSSRRRNQNVADTMSIFTICLELERLYNIGFGAMLQQSPSQPSSLLNPKEPAEKKWPQGYYMMMTTLITINAVWSRCHCVLPSARHCHRCDDNC